MDKQMLCNYLGGSRVAVAIWSCTYLFIVFTFFAIISTGQTTDIIPV